MEILHGVWKQNLRPCTVVGYSVKKTFLPSLPNYVTRPPGCCCIVLEIKLISLALDFGTVSL